MRLIPAVWRMRSSSVMEKLAMTIAWLLPHDVVMWCFIRVVAHATTGEYGATEVPALTAVDALDRWTRGKGPRESTSEITSASAV